MRLAWERRGVVRMTVKVEELAALVAGARVAGHALAAQPGEQTGELERILGDFDRASRALKQEPGASWFHAGSRSLQDRFGTRPLADGITEKFVKDRLEPGDRAFVERADMFFLATADAEGRPSCSYKGGDPGFVTVVDDATIAFPNYDGNGMFLSWGNALANPEVGLLFIDFERGHRMRLNGTATIDGNDELMAAYPGAQFIVLVEGRPIAGVGDRFDGDLLGDDPSGAWRWAAGAAVEACAGEGAMQRLVHLSSGDVPAADYVGERILDLVMHAWDVARAIGADERLDPELVDVARKVLAEKADLWRRHGALGPAVETALGADPQTLLVAESGRKGD